MMSFEDAIAHAKRELNGATYQAETSPYPGIVAINNVRAEWLSQLIAAAERAEKVEAELRECRGKISVETPLGRLEAVLEVVGQQLIGGGDGHSAQLVQRQHA